MMIMVMQTFCK